MTTAGQQAEALAAAHLQQQGLKLLSTNYRCRFGEIDLIMRDGKTLVFVEVRMRSNPHFGTATDSITARKQHKLLLTAQHYLQQHGEQPCRFDAVVMSEITGQHIDWLKNAFDGAV